MDCGYFIYKAGSSDEPACVELTSKIKGSMYNVAKEFVYIGFLLAECDYYETYKEWGYSSIHEYASDQLGFKKSSTYNFINVCKVFCNPTEALPFSYFMKDPYSNFNYSQLVEMLSMNDKQRSQVTPDMSVKQIREVKKLDDSRRLESVPEEAPAPDAPEEAFALEPEIIKNTFCDLTKLAIGELCDLSLSSLKFLILSLKSIF